MRRVKQRDKGGENVCPVKRYHQKDGRGMRNTTPLVEGIMGCYRRFGLDKPKKLKKGRGYKTIDSMARKSGLKGIKLIYEPVSFDEYEYLPIQTIIPKSRSQKGQVGIAPEAILTTDALLEIFPELAEIGALSTMRHEKERCKGKALGLDKRVRLTSKRGAGRMGESVELDMNREIMTNVQHLVAHYKGREEFVKEQAYNLLFTTCLYNELKWVTDKFHFSEKVMMASVYPRYNPFLKKEVMEGIIAEAEEARKELKERVERCHPNKLGLFSIADEVRREIRTLL